MSSTGFPFPIGQRVSMIYTIASSAFISSIIMFAINELFDDFCYLIPRKKNRKVCKNIISSMKFRILIFLLSIFNILPMVKDAFFVMKNKEVFNFMYWFEKYMNIMKNNEVKMMLNLQGK